jgi:hypothetical protein
VSVKHESIISLGPYEVPWPGQTLPYPLLILPARVEALDSSLLMKISSFDRRSWFRHLLTVTACVNIGIFAYIAASHLLMPNTLDPHESMILEHVRRASDGTFTGPLTQYSTNPLYYYMCALLAKLALSFDPKFELTLTFLRQFALIGTIGCGWLLYRVVKRETRSAWLGCIALGLFAGGYKALDCYYDISQRETSVLFLLLGASYLIGYSESRLRDTLGILLFVAAFWMNPHTFLFIVGGLAFLAWRDLKTGGDVMRLWPSVVVAFLLGPALYAWLPGPELISFDWDPAGTGQFAEWLARRFVVLTVLAGAGLQLSLERGRPMTVWVFLFPIAFVSAMLETMTPGFAFSGLIPFAAWVVLTGVLAVPRLERNVPWLAGLHFAEVALCLSFLALAYPPADGLVRQDPAKVQIVGL